VILLTVGCDQGTKAIARSYLKDGKVVSLLGGVLVMRYVENQGAFLSLGAWLPGHIRRVILIAIPLAILAGVVMYVVGKKGIRVLLAMGLSCIAGGGADNLLDRVVRGGKVGDFLNLGFGALRSGIFNVADLCIMLGCLLLIIEASRKSS
jgi:signal peptidase II